jgi:hypothetical protein
MNPFGLTLVTGDIHDYGSALRRLAGICSDTFTDNKYSPGIIVVVPHSYRAKLAFVARKDCL